MTDVFQVAAPKAVPKLKPAPPRDAGITALAEQVAKPAPTIAVNQLGTPVEPKPVKTRRLIHTAGEMKKAVAAAFPGEYPSKKTRRKRTPRIPDLLDEHMLFMKLYNDLGVLPKKARERLLASLMKQLT